jgi:phosphoglucomutase
MPVLHVTAGPFAGQKPGTSGLRKKTAQFRAPHYLECFVQATFDAVGAAGKVLVLGGDGRFFGREAAGIILRMAAANGVARVIVGRGGLLSTPAASHLIRLNGADGGIILSASHNPGGEDGDFGVKYNIGNGGPAPEAVTAAIHRATEALTGYRISDAPAPDLDRLGEVTLDGMAVQVVDPVADHADLMERLFDFPAIRAMISGGFTLRFDAMCAVTGPYAVEVLERRLGAAPGSVVNATPLPDFGGMHPDPNPTWASELYDLMLSDAAPDFGAASDGDGDRNMIMGRGIYVNPSDSLALLAEHAHRCPGYAGGLRGIARSMPTSTAADRVAQALGIPAHETPTGWKFFGTLLDGGHATICGEESFGTGSDHVREKDGLWAALMWLNILAATGHSVEALMTAHWRRFGRTFYSRHDHEALPVAQGEAVMARLRAALAGLPGRTIDGRRVVLADDFAYVDPVDGSVSTGQGLRVVFADGARLVLRLSGTGTEGATLRLYLEQPCDDPDQFDSAPQAMLAPMVAVAEKLSGLAHLTGRTAPDVIT